MASSLEVWVLKMRWQLDMLRNYKTSLKRDVIAPPFFEPKITVRIFGATYYGVSDNPLRPVAFRY